MYRRVAYLGPGALSLVAICLAGPVNALSQVPSTPTEIHVTARQFEFEPKIITVQQGKPVRLLITSADSHHGFAIDELGVDREIKPNATTVVEFTPTKIGRFPFSCSVYCGSGHEKMTGELVVTDQEPGASRMQVRFDETEKGVVIVEAGGERVRIDTRTETVTRLMNLRHLPSPTAKNNRGRNRRAGGRTKRLRLVNVPTPKRVLRGSLNLYFTHRFTQSVRPLSLSDKELFGLDSFAVSSFGLFYGVTDKLYSAYRSPICQRRLCRTIEFGIGYHLLDEGAHLQSRFQPTPASKATTTSRTDYTYNLQLMLARSVTKSVHLFFSPALHLNANGQRRFDPKAEDFFPVEPLGNEFGQHKHGGSLGFGASARIRPTVSLMFEYTPRVGFKLGRVVPVFAPGTSRITAFRNNSQAEIGFGQKHIGRHTFSLTFSNTQTTTTSRYNSSNLVLPPGRFTIGFNLYRRFWR